MTECKMRDSCFAVTRFALFLREHFLDAFFAFEFAAKLGYRGDSATARKNADREEPHIAAMAHFLRFFCKSFLKSEHTLPPIILYHALYDSTHIFSSGICEFSTRTRNTDSSP